VKRQNIVTGKTWWWVTILIFSAISGGFFTITDSLFSNFILTFRAGEMAASANLTDKVTTQTAIL